MSRCKSPLAQEIELVFIETALEPEQQAVIALSRR
jgi:hypothetical protein